MKLKSRYIFFLLLSINLVSCTNNKINQESKKENNNTLSPEIIHLQDTYYYRYFLFKKFQDNEDCIKYLFDFTEKENGDKWILTNEKGVIFEDGSAILDTIYQRFSIDNTENKFYRVKVNFLNFKKIDFKKEIEKNRVELSAIFDTLNLNILQNFLDYAQGDDLKKSQETYIYELYNKDKVKKVVLTYHDNGQWAMV